MPWSEPSFVVVVRPSSSAPAVLEAVGRGERAQRKHHPRRRVSFSPSPPPSTSLDTAQHSMSELDKQSAPAPTAIIKSADMAPEVRPLPSPSSSPPHPLSPPPDAADCHPGLHRGYGCARHREGRAYRLLISLETRVLMGLARGTDCRVHQEGL